MRSDGRAGSRRLPRSRGVAARLLPLCALAATLPLFAMAPRSFDQKLAAFSIAFHDERTAYREAAAFVLPEEPITIEAVGGRDGEYALTAKSGLIAQFGKRKWTWTAPRKAGVNHLRIEGPGSALDNTDTIDLYLFVMVPADAVANGMLNGYRIGRYPDKPLNNNPIYRPPTGFIEVTKDNEDTRLSPHFRLKQFVCKQGSPGDYPKYVVLNERLPITLETALDEMNHAGFDVDTLHVMSGYRTPYYNAAIGDVEYSMHQWGRAADFYIDSRDRGVMDDLNGDGRIDIGDAKLVYDRLETLVAQPAFKRLQGGMGYYPATTAHPPFVHVDTRGTKARWKG